MRFNQYCLKAWGFYSVNSFYSGVGIFNWYNLSSPPQALGCCVVICNQVLLALSFKFPPGGRGVMQSNIQSKQKSGSARDSYHKMP